MYFKTLLVVAALLGSALSSPQDYHYQNGAVNQDSNYENPAMQRYSFSYGVQDQLSGDFKTMTESRDGHTVQGSYSLVEPDGSTRTVHYTADPVHGFNAVVRRDGRIYDGSQFSSANALFTPENQSSLRGQGSTTSQYAQNNQRQSVSQNGQQTQVGFYNPQNSQNVYSTNYFGNPRTSPFYQAPRTTNSGSSSSTQNNYNSQNNGNGQYNQQLNSFLGDGSYQQFQRQSQANQGQNQELRRQNEAYQRADITYLDQHQVQVSQGQSQQQLNQAYLNQGHYFQQQDQSNQRELQGRQQIQGNQNQPQGQNAVSLQTTQPQDQSLRRIGEVSQSQSSRSQGSAYLGQNALQNQQGQQNVYTFNPNERAESSNALSANYQRASPRLSTQTVHSSDLVSSAVAYRTESRPNLYPFPDLHPVPVVHSLSATPVHHELHVTPSPVHPVAALHVTSSSYHHVPVVDAVHVTPAPLHHVSTAVNVPPAPVHHITAIGAAPTPLSLVHTL